MWGYDSSDLIRDVVQSVNAVCKTVRRADVFRAWISMLSYLPSARCCGFRVIHVNLIVRIVRITLHICVLM